MYAGMKILHVDYVACNDIACSSIFMSQIRKHGYPEYINIIIC